MYTITVKKISELLQILENEIPDGKSLNRKIKIPKEIIRSAETIKSNYSFLDVVTRSNISYAIEALDLYRWILNRFYLYGPVLSYTVKSGIILISMICEALVRDILKKKKIVVKNKYSKNICKLESILLSKDRWIIQELEIMKAIRNTQHLHLVNILENEEYTIDHWNRSIQCLKGLLELAH